MNQNYYIKMRKFIVYVKLTTNVIVFSEMNNIISTTSSSTFRLLFLYFKNYKLSIACLPLLLISYVVYSFLTYLRFVLFG